MGFQYNNLWKIIEESGMTKDQFRNKIGASQTTIVKMGRNENVSLDIIDRACVVLNCTPNDIIEYVPENLPIKQKISYFKGDIVLYARFMDLTPEREERNNNNLTQILILQDNDWYNITHHIIGVPFSMRLTNTKKPTDILIQADETNKLEMNAVISVDDIAPYRLRNIVEKVGKLTLEDMSRIDKLTRQLFGL